MNLSLTCVEVRAMLDSRLGKAGAKVPLQRPVVALALNTTRSKRRTDVEKRCRMSRCGSQKDSLN